MQNFGDLTYRISRKMFNSIRHPDKHTYLTVAQVIAQLNETAGLKGNIRILDIAD